MKKYIVNINTGYNFYMLSFRISHVKQILRVCCSADQLLLHFRPLIEQYNPNECNCHETPLTHFLVLIWQELKLDSSLNALILTLTHNFKVFIIRQIGLIFLTLAVITCSGNGPIGPGEEKDIMWEETNGPLGGIVSSLAISSIGDLFAGTWGSGVFRSTDNGERWTRVNTGLTNATVQTLAINQSRDIFAGTIGSGIFRSTDNGDSWTEVKTG